MSSAHQFETLGAIWTKNYVHYKLPVLSQMLHSSSHAMTVLAVEEMRSVVLVLLKNAALEVAYHFKLLQEYVDSALVRSCSVPRTQCMCTMNVGLICQVCCRL